MLPSNANMNKPIEIMEFKYPRDIKHSLLVSYDEGGKDLSDTSDNLTLYNWKARTDGTSVWCKRIDLQKEYLLFTDINITEIDLTFDQNMFPHIAYVSNGIAKLWWYDSTVSQRNITEYPDIKYPRISLDDKRRISIHNSDIIFGYIKNNGLYYRLQRNRYAEEHLIEQYTSNHNKVLWKIGMSKDNRFLFYVR